MTTEEGIKNIRSYFGKLSDWRNLTDLIPKKFIKSKFLKKTGLASLFAGSLELSKEGDIEIKQTMPFDNLLVRQKQ